MKRFAIIADAHITDTPDTPKRQALKWCAQRIRELAPDAILLLGDMTATGKLNQAQFAMQTLQSAGVPVFSTPGNAEYRSGVAKCVSLFTVAAPYPVCLADSGNYRLSPEDRSRIAALPDNGMNLLGTHTHYTQWPEADRQVVLDAIRRHAIASVIAGHSHVDGEEIMRGIDPDKASGGVPAFELWTQNEDGSWTRLREEMPGVAPASWTPDERLCFLRNLGVSCMYDCLKNIRSATELGIQTLELRADAVFETDRRELQKALALWRKTAVGALSLHLPSLKASGDQSKLQNAVRAAIELECNRVTLHVPAVTAAEFPCERDTLEKNFMDSVSPLLARGIRIGIENLHTRPPRELTPETRNYGCSIQECRAWIDELRKITQSDLIGFHLDIGHARNNPPFAAEENLSDYYRQLGPLTNGMHLHQVRQNADGTMSNHTGLDCFYGKLISLSGLFIAFRRGMFPKEIPMYLEISENDAGIECWKKLSEQLLI